MTANACSCKLLLCLRSAIRTGLSSSSRAHWKSWHIALLTARGIVNIKCTDVFVLSFGKLLEIWSAGFLDTPFIQLSVSVSLRCMYHASLCVCVLTMVSSSQFIDVLVYWQTTVSITVTMICLLQFVHVCWLTADNVDDFCFFFAGKCCHLGWGLQLAQCAKCWWCLRLNSLMC